MTRFSVLISICLALISCSKVENAPDAKAQTLSPTPSPTTQIKTETKPALKTVFPAIKLSSKQQKYLNDSLPPQVRELLEKAEKFEVFAELRAENEFDGEGTTFEPNRIANITNEKDKKEILEAFYKDAADEDSPANCWEPRHSLRATRASEVIEIEICFACSRFEVKSPFGGFSGTIRRANRKSESVFNRIIINQGIVLQ